MDKAAANEVVREMTAGIEMLSDGGFETKAQQAAASALAQALEGLGLAGVLDLLAMSADAARDINADPGFCGEGETSGEDMVRALGNVTRALLAAKRSVEGVVR